MIQNNVHITQLDQGGPSGRYMNDMNTFEILWTQFRNFIRLLHHHFLN